MDAQMMYDAITSHWESMLKIKDPLDIDVEVNNQRKKCDALLEQKDQLIDELKYELKRADYAYYEDLDKQVSLVYHAYDEDLYKRVSGGRCVAREIRPRRNSFGHR